MTEPMKPAQIAAMVVKLRDRQASWIGDGTLPDALCRSAADALEAQAAETARLTAVNEALHQAHPYNYIGKNGKPILARDLEYQRDAAEAKVAALTAALRFYADSETYETQYERMSCECCTNIFEPINEDKGAKARAALGGSL
jgi:capsid protein